MINVFLACFLCYVIITHMIIIIKIYKSINIFRISIHLNANKMKIHK